MVNITAIMENPTFQFISSPLVAAIIILIIPTIGSIIYYRAYKKMKEFSQKFVIAKFIPRILPHDLGLSGRFYHPYYLSRSFLDSTNRKSDKKTIEEYVKGLIISGHDIAILRKPDAGKTRCAYEIIRGLPKTIFVIRPFLNEQSEFLKDLDVPIRTLWLKKIQYLVLLDDAERFGEMRWIDDLISSLGRNNPVTILATIRTGFEFEKAEKGSLFQERRFSPLLWGLDSIFQIPDLTDEEGEMIAGNTNRIVPSEFHTIRTPGAILLDWADYIARYCDLSDDSDEKGLMMAGRLLLHGGLFTLTPDRLNAALHAIGRTDLSRERMIAAESRLRKNDLIGWDDSGLFTAGGKILEKIVIDLGKDQHVLDRYIEILVEFFKDQKDWEALLQMGLAAQIRHEFVKASTYYERVTTINDKFPIVWSIWGVDLSFHAMSRYKEGNPEEGRKYFEEAFAKFEKAVEVKPDFHEAWYNWGIALVTFAKALYGEGKNEEGRKYFEKAFEKYRQATGIKEKFNDAWYNWGTHLATLGEILYEEGNPEEGRKYFEEAFKKFKKAVEIKPDDYEAWYNWGSTLVNFAKTLQREGKTEECRKYFEEAFRKCEKAVEVKPEYYEAWNIWGTYLAILAVILYSDGNPKEGWKYFGEAFRKYEKTVNVKPDYHGAWYNWGIDLSTLAEILYRKGKTEEGQKCFGEAFKKFEKAVEIKPDYPKAWYSWGTSLAIFAEFCFPMKEIESRNLFDQAFKNFDEAVKIAPNIWDGWYNYGIALSRLVDLISNKNPEEADKLRIEAQDKFRKAAQIKTEKKRNKIIESFDSA